MGEKFNGYKTGRFEAMQSTRNALTGDKRRLDLLSRMKANPKEKPLVFNSQDQDTIDQVKSAEANRDRRQLDKLIKTHNELSQKYMLDTILADRAMEMAPKIWKAVDHRLNQEAQKKIQEKIEARVAAAQAKKEQEKQAKPLSEFEMTMMVWKLLAEAQNKALKKTTEEVALFIIDRLPGPVYRALSVLGVISLVLAACASFTPNPEFNPAGDNNTPSGEMTDLPEETSEPVGEPTSLPEAEPTADPLLIKVETGLGSNPNSQTSYVRALEIHNNESMVQACLDFVKRLDNRIDINYNTIGINQYGICYAKSDDGSQIIFDKWDANGPLYVTRAAGFDLLSKLNPQATDGKTEEDFSLEENAANTFAVLKDDQGNLTEVGVGINGQWGTTGSTELVATPTAPSANSETDLEEENLLTSNPEVIASMVDDFANKKTEFPRDLNPEQYSAFIDEMNNHVGRKSIWVETNDGNVLYYDVKQNKMVSVPGTYEQNRDLIEQNQIELFVKIETDPETGNIQFVNSEGELVTSPNSADVDWNLVVDASNYKNGPIDFPNAFKSENSDAWYDKIIGGVSPHEIVQKLKQAFMPGILMDDIVCKIVQEQNGWKQYPCINIMFIKADKDGNPLYGIRTMVGGGPNIFVGEEGGEIDTSTTGVVELRDSDDIRKLETGSVYYVGAPINQDIVWQEANKSDIDALQGVGPESNKYTNISSENMPDDGNIVIAGAVLIKKK